MDTSQVKGVGSVRHFPALHTLVDREPSKEVNHPTQSRAALTELSLENLRKYPNSDLGLKCVSEPRWYTELC